jgi:hypothetical protein
LSTFDRLAYLLKENRYALFLGAGASVESGGYTASEIAWAILRKIYGVKPEGELQKLFETEYGKPVNFENVLESISTSSIHRREIIREFFKEMAPSEGYRYLAMLLKAGYFYPIVLTTNFDHMLEDSLKKEGVAVKVLTAEELTSPPIKPSEGEIVIVKLHGDISKPDSLKFTTLETMQLPEATEKLIIQICEQQGIIVVGYRAQDIDVRNALQKAKPSAKGLFWVSKDILDESKDEEIFLLLEKHNSTKNIISGITFDNFFRKMGTDLSKVIIRGRYEQELNEAWMLLDRARSFSKERKEILQRLSELSAQLLKEIRLEEALALREFVEYELNKSGETYRLRQGIHFLERAIEGYRKYMSKEKLIILEYAFLGELLNLFLTGEPVPGERIAYLDQLIMRAEALLREIPRKEVITRARTLIILAEALKEKAMITVEPGKQIENYTRARKFGEEAISLLREIDSPESKYLLAAAYRHAAVTYELEGDIVTDENEREKCYKKWMEYSFKAVSILREISEDAVRGYALMNLASSYTRLCEFEVKNKNKRRLLEEGKEYLEESIKCLQGVEDHRGIGWAYVHLCENTRQRIDLSRDDHERSILLSELENYANRAIVELKQVEDHLAQGLAYEELGIALYLISMENEENGKIRLERAISALKEGVNKLKATGFYRGYSEAAFWLGRCQFALWKRTSNVNYVIESIHSLLDGIVQMATALKIQNKLENIYQLLETEIRKLL